MASKQRKPQNVIWEQAEFWQQMGGIERMVRGVNHEKSLRNHNKGEKNVNK